MRIPASIAAFLALVAPVTAPARALADEGAATPSKVPEPPCVLVPVDLAVWTNISINRLYRPCARNVFGFALGQGQAGELRGLQIGVLAQSAKRSVRGVQLAGLVVAGGEDVIGLQVAGLVAAAGERFTGVQIAGIAASGEALRGIQLGVLGTASGDHAAGITLGGLFAASGEAMRGIQVGGLFAASGEAMRGIQVGGLFAASGEELRGVQVGGLFVASGEELRGVQVGGLFAASGEGLRGVQVGGLFSAAGRLDTGLQIGGLASLSGGGRGVQVAATLSRTQGGDLTGAQIAIVNMAQGVTGAQIGLVNIARRVHGVQLGLVNVADDADAPIGLVSWMRRGERAVEVWGGEAVPLAAAARFGTRRVYSLLGVAADPLHDRRTWGPVGGAGVRIPAGPVAAHLDALAHGLFADGVDEQAILTQARLRMAVPVTERLALSAGVTWNVYVSDDDDGADLPLVLDHVDRDGDLAVRQWPGLTLGAAMSY